MNRLLPARLQAALSGEGKAWLEPPPELLRESRRRIRLAALLGAMAYALFLTVLVTGFEDSSGLEYAIDLRHDLLGVGLCSLLAVVAWLPAVSDRTVTYLALAIELLLATVISTHAPWAAFVRTGHVGALTWVVPIVILFALLVPLPAPIVFAASLACVLTIPLGLGLLGARHAVTVPGVDFWNASLTGAVGLSIATLAARTVYGARRQIDAARSVGSYELIERLGQGGMGEVWKARHQLLARPSAVKLILAENLRGTREDRAAAIERFTREAQVTAGLRSPHTVELFDFGSSDGGMLYYAMELLDGINLEHFVYRFGPVEPERAVHWLRQVCHSLAEAHAQGLVHRDIKPANLFVCRYGRDVDFVKLLDFGISKPLEDPASPALTQPGIRIGTPSYMAPEQVFGLESGPQTDLYALGCVGYWLLTGGRLFESDSPAELMRQHAQEAPPSLAGRTRHPVPAGLERALLRCLSKSPAERPRDADELSAALAASLDGTEWRAESARAWWEEHWPARGTPERGVQERNEATTVSQ